MQCPHCLQHFHSNPTRVHLGKCGDDDWTITLEACANCNEAIILLFRMYPTDKQTLLYVHPRFPGRPPLSDDVPEVYAQDYYEAGRLLPDSRKASAALGRRCLRRLLRETVGMRDSDLSKEIATLIASKQLPKHLAEALDAVRNLGNFGGHPLKSTNPGEISDAEPGEAEWLLDTLDGLFNFYFVQPAETERKRAALMSKLRVAWQNPVAQV
jgi:hypothetical protein